MNRCKKIPFEASLATLILAGLLPSCGLQTDHLNSAQIEESAPNTQTNWLVLYYGMGDNNLANDILNDLREMESFGSSSTAVVVAQADFAQEALGDDEPDRRIVIPGKFGAKIPGWSGKTGLEQPVKTFAELDTGDPKTLKDFITWGTSSFKAQHYALVLSGHGYGYSAKMRPSSPTSAANRLPIELRPNPNNGFRYFSFDETPTANTSGKSVLTTVELREVLESFKTTQGKAKIEVVVADSCVSQTIENAVELRHATDIFVASQESERASGHDWGRTLRALEEAKSRAFDPVNKTLLPFDAEIFANAMVAGYVGQNLNNSQLSALRLSKLDPFVEQIHLMAKEASQHKDIVSEWMKRRATYFGGVLGPRMWVDTLTMARELADMGAISQQTSNALRTSFIGNRDDKSVLLTNMTRGRGAVGTTTGVSITFPGFVKGDNAGQRSVGWEIQLELGLAESAVTRGSVLDLLDSIHCPPEKPCDVNGEPWPQTH